MSQNMQNRGFTLTELLVVIGVIVLLIGILIPVVSRVRVAGQVADTQQFISSLQGAIERYYQDHRAYPGPLNWNQINAPAGLGGLTPAENQRITGTENLVLGLLGGLENVSGNIQYNPALVGQGPRSLNPANPRIYPVYIEKANLSEGSFSDAAGNANDSPIPEFVDRFTDPLPILYLRARVGAPGSGNTAADNPIVTNGTRLGQYDLSQIIGYTGANIGVGRTIRSGEYKPTGYLTFPQHGLQTVDPSSTLASHYPYDLHPFLRHPTIPNTPRQKDGYILISAGQDRVYGTADDIVSFGRIGQ